MTMKAKLCLLFVGGVVLLCVVRAQLNHQAKVEAALNSSMSDDGRMCLYWTSPENMFPPDCLTLRQYNLYLKFWVSTLSPEERAQIEADLVRDLRESGWSAAQIASFRKRYERNVTNAP